MNIFQSHKKLDFSTENIELLSESVTELKTTLSKIGTSVGSLELTNLLASALRNDSESFKKYALSIEVFGGAGSLCDIYCGDEKLQAQFQKGLRKFCIVLKNCGIKNKRVDQIIKERKNYI